MQLVIDDFEGLARQLREFLSYDIRVAQRRVADTIKGQVERRIATEKRDPNGLPWAPWSPGYARTRGSQHSLLVDTGDLLDSFVVVSEGSEVHMGTEIEYAPKNDKERPFMGLSTDNKSELTAMLLAWMAER